FDIARALSTPAFEAERIKKEYGTLAKAAADDDEVVLHALAGGRSPALSQTTRGQIRQIVGSRMLDLFGRVAESLGRLDVAHDAVQRMVLTGGASQPAGLGELAADFFARPVRIA